MNHEKKINRYFCRYPNNGSTFERLRWKWKGSRQRAANCDRWRIWRRLGKEYQANPRKV